MNTLSKLLICENLKNWYLIDSILLNGHAKKVIVSENDFQEYISLKAALLSNLFEFYRHIDYIPRDRTLSRSDRQLQECAVRDAKKSKSVAASMIQSESFVSTIKSFILKEAKEKNIKNIREFSDKIITSRFLKMALDNMLIGVPVIESNDPSKCSDFKGELLEQTYLTIRSDLIKMTSKYFHSTEGLKKN